MRKFIKIILSIFSVMILSTIIIPVVASILLSSYTVQNYIISRAAEMATQYLGTTVSIDKIKINLFNRVAIEGLYVEDYNGDTLAYAGDIDAALRGFNPITGMIRLGDVKVKDTKFFLLQDSTMTLNLNTILEKLKSDKPKKPSSNDFKMRVANLTLQNVEFRYSKYIVPEKPYGINFADLDFTRINMDIAGVGIVNDSINGVINSISFIEKSGFQCHNISSTKAVVSSHGMRLDNLRIKDNYSDINVPDFHFGYSTWSAYKDFITQVEMSASLKKCFVSFKTIAFFAPSLNDWQSEIAVTGEVKGTVSDLNARIHDAKTRDTELSAVVRIAGLPDVPKTTFMFDVSRLNTNANDVEFIFKDITRKSIANVSTFLVRMGDLSLTGKFNGLLKDFKADAILGSSIGGADLDFRMEPMRNQAARITGNVKLLNFSLGNLLASKDLGTTTTSANISGIIYKDSIRISTDAEIAKLHFSGYNYTNIKIKGDIHNKLYSGFVGCDDPNIDFSLNGFFDFNNKIPRYDFDLDLRNADLHALGFNKRDSVSVLRCKAFANARGATINDIDGRIVVGDILYNFNEDTIATKDITLTANNFSDDKLITINSDFADVEIRSRQSFYDFPLFFKRSLAKYLPSLSIRSDSVAYKNIASRLNAQTNSTDNYYILKANVKETNKVMAAFVPELHISEGTKLSFMFNPATNNLSLTLNSELIEYKNMYLADLNLTNRNQADSMTLFVRTSEFGVGNIYMPDFTIISGARNNTINIGVGFKNDLNNSAALINTTSVLRQNHETESLDLDVRFNSSQLVVGDNIWRINSPRITVSKGLIDIERFRVTSAGQNLDVYGKISDKQSDTLHVAFRNFDLAPLSGLMDRFGYQVSGRTNGHADLMALTGKRLFSADISTTNVMINSRSIPDTYFISRWDREDNRIRLTMNTSAGDSVITGSYRPSDKKYFVKAELKDIDLYFLRPILNGVMSDIDGKANAFITFNGTGNRPALNGRIDIPSFGGKIDFTNVRYTMNNGVIDIVNNNFILQRNKVYDDNTGSADIDMTLNTRYLSDLSYDITISPNKLLALNTTQLNSDLFYGTAYASGLVKINGDKRGVKININATTENNSNFVMPLAGGKSISEADFIVFEDTNKKTVDSDDAGRRGMKLRQQKIESNSVFDMTMTLNVRPNTEVQLEPLEANVIKANGTGLITMRIVPTQGIFTMNGDYVINEGSYDFSLPGLPVSKQFTIKNGSDIQWTGNALDAMLNIVAQYRTRTSLAPLMGGEDVAMRQNVPVVCEIMLTDRLLQPTINFNVTVPTGDTEIQSIVNNALGTQEMRSTQFLSLLVMNSFFSDNTSNSNIGTIASVSTGIEFLTSQISSWFSSDKVKFNFGYRPKSELASDEIDFSYSHNITNRLSIEAEANYSLGNNQPLMADRSNSQLTGDFYVTYIFDRIGNLRARAFTRTIDRFDENQGLQESGVGLYYRQSFNSFRDLFMRRKKQPTPVIDSTATN